MSPLQTVVYFVYAKMALKGVAAITLLFHQLGQSL